MFVIIKINEEELFRLTRVTVRVKVRVTVRANVRVRVRVKVKVRLRIMLKLRVRVIVRLKVRVRAMGMYLSCCTKRDQYSLI